MTLDYIYHFGHLAVDREERGRDGQLTRDANQANERAARVWRSYLAGKVVLYQIHLRDGYAEYHCRAIKGA